ncbi:MAG: amidophosphoribosyltransferase [Acutalibacteraceae bacterium]|nr:amidophosphoribosyltransferase [Acutalibacteraceae bacterium]
MNTDINEMNFYNDEKPHEECGVFGIYKNDDDINTVAEVYSGLYALQHRGQHSAGICVNDNGKFKCYKNNGVVSEALDVSTVNELPNGKIAIGHVRHSFYSNDNRNARNHDKHDIASVQPLLMRYINGSLAIAHNGAITNIAELHKELEEGGAIFQSNSNAELIAYVIASRRLQTSSIEDAVLKAMDMVEGAYSIVMTSPSKLIAVRDPHGFRPLCLGKIKNSYLVSSESCAFDSLGAEFIRDIQPGEMVVIDEEGLHSYTEHCGQKTSMCIFEQIYVSRPDSVIDNQCVHNFRMNVGATLAKKYPVEADVVCGVPDSGVSCAIGYANASGIPYGVAIIKNKYLGRTLAMSDSNNLKQRTLEIKINVLKPTVDGKRVVIIDDSVVRGGTIAHIVELLKKAGAKEVHVRVASPQFRETCYYGTNLPAKEEFVSYTAESNQICEKIGADSLEFIQIEDLLNCANDSKVDFCTACFTGNYPTEVPAEKFVDKFSKKLVK